MAVTQYIGSRYVPLLADPVEWSAEKEYEALTIVTHQGNSYTSRQFVPKGTDIDNMQFWALTGNYNAQIELYRQETRQAVERIEDWYDAAVAEYANKYAAKAFSFENVEAMQEARDVLYVGAICHTNGFYSNGDNGDAWYIITDVGTPNNKDIIACGSTLRANLIITESFVTPEMYGAHGDGINDDTSSFDYALYNNKNVIAKNTYQLNGSITVTNCDLICTGTLKCNTTGVIIKDNDFHNVLINNVIKNNRAQDGSIGVLVDSTSYCNINVLYIANFAIGIQLFDADEVGGTFRNNVNVRRCSTLNGLQIKATASGWVNGNNINIYYFPHTFTNVIGDVYGVEFVAGSNNFYNANIIHLLVEYTYANWNYKPKFMLFNKAQHNTVYLERTEINGGSGGGSGEVDECITFANDSQNNNVYISDPFYIRSYTLKNESRFVNNVYYHDENIMYKGFKNNSYSVVAIDDTKCKTTLGLISYNSSVGLVQVSDYTTANIPRAQLNSYWNIGANCSVINTSDDDIYICLLGSSYDTPFIFMMQMFDADNTILTDSEIITTPNDYLNTSPSFYLHGGNTVGVYRASQKLNKGAFCIHVSSNVKKLLISCAGYIDNVYVSPNCVPMHE